MSGAEPGRALAHWGWDRDAGRSYGAQQPSHSEADRKGVAAQREPRGHPAPVVRSHERHVDPCGAPHVSQSELHSTKSTKPEYMRMQQLSPSGHWAEVRQVALNLQGLLEGGSASTQVATQRVPVGALR